MMDEQKEELLHDLLAGLRAMNIDPHAVAELGRSQRAMESLQRTADDMDIESKLATVHLTDPSRSPAALATVAPTAVSAAPPIKLGSFFYATEHAPHSADKSDHLVYFGGGSILVYMLRLEDRSVPCFALFNEGHKGWTVPGGATSDREHGYAACVRETYEETAGLIDLQMVGIWEAFRWPSSHRSRWYYLAVAVLKQPILRHQFSEARSHAEKKCFREMKEMTHVPVENLFTQLQVEPVKGTPFYRGAVRDFQGHVRPVRDACMRTFLDPMLREYLLSVAKTLTAQSVTAVTADRTVAGVA